jgi:peptidoglycan/xylan/chitin deacetylase (PgdA/CDA1 family)
LADERFRVVGSGNINSVSWGRQGEFYYLTENILYRVINPELFTRTMYGDFLSIGDVVSVFPIDFNSNFDNYWIAPDSSSILINKGGKGLFFFLLGGNQITSALPHVTLPFGAESLNVLWPASGPITVLFSVQNETKVWRFEISRNSIVAAEQTIIPASTNGVLSPDETRVIFWGERGLELWNYTEWRLVQRLSDIPVFSCAWVNNRSIISGNTRFIEEINVSVAAYPRRQICLSGADEIGFEETRGVSRILARSGSTWYATDGNSAWTSVNNIQIRPISFSSERFRVFLEPQRRGGPFQNNLMIRNLQSFGTVPLLTQNTANNVFAPEVINTSGEPHLNLPGNRMQIALCFDLYDDATGLVQVLSALRRFNVKATFFLNGEFIRRNPLAAKAIADAGHEAASLFYAPIDLSDTRYRITQIFISQGLARNEDEFNRVTGRELSALWHPPFYRSSALVNAAAAAVGYYTVERSIDPGDWLSREDSLRLNLRQVSPSEMIEQIIIRRHSGAVIPIRLGLLSGGRNEYLFEYIEVLLDALIRSGCEIVPVSSVIRR